MEERICLKSENGFELYHVGRPEAVLSGYYVVYFPERDFPPFGRNLKLFLCLSEAEAFYEAFKWGYEYAKAN